MLLSCAIALAITECVMKDWSCERLILVVNAFSLTVARIVGLHLGCSVDEDAVVKLKRRK